MSIKNIYIRINFYIVRLFVNLHYEFVCRGWAGRVFYVETELFRFKILISTLVGTYIDVNRTTAPDQTRRASLIDRPSIVFWYNSEKNREKSVKNVNTNIHQGEVEINSDASLQEAGWKMATFTVIFVHAISLFMRESVRILSGRAKVGQTTRLINNGERPGRFRFVRVTKQRLTEQEKCDSSWTDRPISATLWPALQPFSSELARTWDRY